MDAKINQLKNNCRVDDSSYIEEFEFRNGYKVPLYDIKNTGAFNQMIGFAKFLNSQYGNVYYRGTRGLYDNVLPSLMRNRTKGIPNDLVDILNRIQDNTRLKDSLKLRPTKKPLTKQDYSLNKNTERFNKYTIEALLQHYVGSTRFLDVVDNHWIALWMGLHDFHLRGKGNKFCECIRRQLPIGDTYEQFLSVDKTNIQKDIYVYVLMIAMPHAENKPIFGITETTNFVEVDLRKALPSFYLRPHAQHALVVRKRDKPNVQQKACYYDMSSQVVGILRIRVDRANDWLGYGNLMSMENLFPSPSVDQGYNTLLMNNEVFKNPFEIIKYY